MGEWSLSHHLYSSYQQAYLLVCHFIHALRRVFIFYRDFCSLAEAAAVLVYDQVY